jgi:membrane protein DedA with SNARE-associated domain
MPGAGNIYVAIFLATLSTTFVPVPEEVTLLAAGYAARVGEVTLPGAIAMGLAAVVLGDALSYVFGRTLLARLLRTRLGRRLLPERWRAWGERFVEAHAVRAIVVARFLVGLRGFVYFALGASRYPFARFLAIDALVGVVEVGGLVALGFGFGELRHHAGTARAVDLAVAALLVLALFAPSLVKHALRRREATRDPSA